MTERFHEEKTDTNSFIRSIENDDFEVLCSQNKQKFFANDTVIGKVRKLALFKV